MNIRCSEIRTVKNCNKGSKSYHAEIVQFADINDTQMTKWKLDIELVTELTYVKNSLGKVGKIPLHAIGN